jgi:hypothetical protein
MQAIVAPRVASGVRPQARGENIHDRLLRSADFWLQNCTKCRHAVQTGFARLTYEKVESEAKPRFRQRLAYLGFVRPLLARCSAVDRY